MMKIKFTMEIADQEKNLEFLDLRIKCVAGKLYEKKNFMKKF